MTIMIPTWVDGTLTPVEKLEAHRRGLRHKAVSVFVLGKDGILLQQRALSKYHTPGLWANTCCTHPFWEEESQACATRRLHEELGLAGLTLTYRDQVEYRADVGNDLIEHEVVDIFTAIAAPDLKIVANPEEVMATRWCTLRALRDDIAHRPEQYTPWLRIYLEDFAERIFDPDLLNV